MAETPRAETDALLALLGGDLDEALRIIDEELTPQRRAALVERATFLAVLADVRRRCPSCGDWAPDGQEVVRGVAHEPRVRWHRSCYMLDLERRAAAGDRRARLMLGLRRRSG